MAIQRPSNDLKNKVNVIPVGVRTQEATAEDFIEISDILESLTDAVETVTGVGTPNPNYGTYTTLALLQAAHPTGESGAYAVIDAGIGNTPQIALWDITDTEWVLNSVAENVIFVANEAALPAPGVANKQYITLDAFKVFIWHNSQYNLIYNIKSTSELINNGPDGYSKYLNEEDLRTLISISKTDNDTFLYYGDVVWLTGLTFYVFVQRYKIGGVLRETILSRTVTLDTADVTFPRYDSFIVQDNGSGNPDTIEVLKGVASNDPSKRVPNLNTQLEISFARISPGATQPDGVSSTVVYKEHLGGEAVITSDNGSIDPDSTNLPISGTKSILCTNPPHETDTYFTLPAAQYTSDNKILVFDIKLDQAWPFLSRNRLTLDFYLMNGTNVFTGRVRVGSDFGFGFDGAVVGQVQKVAIRLNRFSNWSSQNTFDKIWMRHQRLNNSTFRIDNFEIVNSVETSAINTIVRTSQIGINDGSRLEDDKVYLEADLTSIAVGDIGVWNGTEFVMQQLFIGGGDADGN